MFNCHINVEVCSTIKAVKYLYKYIYKGHDKVIYRLVTTPEDENVDEIRQFHDARGISPPEAMWRIYRTMLTQFFWMNANHPKAKQQKLLYLNFPEEYVWDTKTRTWHERKDREVIGRIVTANPKEGERYYLRMLLVHIPSPTSYAYLQTVDGVTYQSFRDAMAAHGLLKTDDSNEKCVEEACAYQMPISLRQLFCTILVYCAPMNPTELFLKFEAYMIEDYLAIQRKNLHGNSYFRHSICNYNQWGRIYMISNYPTFLLLLTTHQFAEKFKTKPIFTSLKKICSAQGY
ncbi:hypothetical protein RHGRI_033625 [Rhododendron griersonianum]|uniref:Helitron helicase-like domain-containing protein n=1 Tax=Rhododendron griersonianum TaxID=479676 RepID=A0AAV6HXH6_9ERIC|nr:hypothetical protein RHGRI_033625 [Rhododendron griersonianum]